MENSTAQYRRTPLHSAAYYGRVEILDYLLQNSSHPDIWVRTTTSALKTPLHTIAWAHELKPETKLELIDVIYNRCSHNTLKVLWKDKDKEEMTALEYSEKRGIVDLAVLQKLRLLEMKLALEETNSFLN